MSISQTGYGVDVAVRRADDLDKRLLAEVAKTPGATVLDLGCGAGGGAARLSSAGAFVTGVDQYDFFEQFCSIANSRFVETDITDYQPTQVFDFGLCQRTLHYLRYKDAKKFLLRLRPFVNQKLFLSLSGLESDLQRGYAVEQRPIEDRFEYLTESDQATFGITHQLCLYTKDEAIELLETSGWEVLEVWQSAFGNIKSIAKPISTNV